MSDGTLARSRRVAVSTVERASAAALGVVLRRAAVRDRFLAPEIARSDLAGGGAAAASRRCEIESSGTDPGPVFVLSAGWGSGSTLVQRLLISSGEVLVWGEPMDIAAPVPRLAASMAAVSGDWPPAEHFRDDLGAAALTDAWIANLAPALSSYRDAHRAFFERWLGADATRSGYGRWGMKEVRLTIDHALYLKCLFPSARFLFVYRDVHASYLSVRRKPWLSVWPDHSATNIISFAHHWTHLLRGFVERHHEVDGLMIRYEDLIGGRFDVQSIARHVGVERVDESVMETRVGGRSARRRPVILPERVVLDSVAGDLRRELGYA